MLGLMLLRSFRLITGRFLPSILSSRDKVLRKWSVCCCFVLFCELQFFATFPGFPLWSVVIRFLKSGSRLVSFLALETLKIVFYRLSQLTRCWFCASIAQFSRKCFNYHTNGTTGILPENKLLIQGGHILISPVKLNLETCWSEEGCSLVAI